MRFVTELTNGVETQINLSGGNTSTSGISYAQPIEGVKDLLQATRLEIGLHIFAASFQNASGDLTARLLIETSMQNTDATSSLWEPVFMGTGNESGIDLKVAMADNVPILTTWTVSQDFGRYFRWRIHVDGVASGDAVLATVIFKVTLLGHG